jgi:hypothetical protein
LSYSETQQSDGSQTLGIVTLSPTYRADPLGEFIAQNQEAWDQRAADQQIAQTAGGMDGVDGADNSIAAPSADGDVSIQDTGAAESADPLGDFIAQNQEAWDQRVVSPQVTQTSQPGAADSSQPNKTLPEITVTAERPQDSEEGINSFFEGLLGGDFSDNTSLSATGGQIAGGAIPIWGQIADFRDTVAALGQVINGEDGGWLNLGTALLGWIPVVGDGAKAIIRGGMRVIDDVGTGVAQGAARRVDDVGGVGAKGETAAEKAVGTSEGAANAATGSKLADDLASKMIKPQVSDPKLAGLMDDLYRDGAKIGTGSTADAVRYENATKSPVGNVFHTQKANDYSTALQKWLDANPNASFNDRSAAQNVLRDLQNALKGN